MDNKKELLDNIHTFGWTENGGIIFSLIIAFSLPFKEYIINNYFSMFSLKTGQFLFLLLLTIFLLIAISSHLLRFRSLNEYLTRYYNKRLKNYFWKVLGVSIILTLIILLLLSNKLNVDIISIIVTLAIFSAIFYNKIFEEFQKGFQKRR
jgi:hypothetical protein